MHGCFWGVCSECMGSHLRVVSCSLEHQLHSLSSALTAHKLAAVFVVGQTAMRLSQEARWKCN